MSKYINADKLIAKLRKHLIPTVLDRDYDEWENGKDAGLQQAINIVESLQQKQLEVDLEKEIEEHVEGMPMSEFTHESEVDIHYDWARKEFKYFFELGLKIRKEE